MALAVMTEGEVCDWGGGGSVGGSSNRVGGSDICWWCW